MKQEIKLPAWCDSDVCLFRCRCLQVIVKQEICRKLGYAVQVEEEMLKVQLEHLQVELNHPTQFKVGAWAAARTSHTLFFYLFFFIFNSDKYLFSKSFSK